MSRCSAHSTTRWCRHNQNANDSNDSQISVFQLDSIWAWFCSTWASTANRRHVWHVPWNCGRVMCEGASGNGTPSKGFGRWRRRSERIQSGKAEKGGVRWRWVSRVENSWNMKEPWRGRRKTRGMFRVEGWIDSIDSLLLGISLGPTAFQAKAAWVWNMRTF